MEILLATLGGGFTALFVCIICVSRYFKIQERLLNERDKYKRSLEIALKANEGSVKLNDRLTAKLRDTERDLITVDQQKHELQQALEFQKAETLKAQHVAEKRRKLIVEALACRTPGANGTVVKMCRILEGNAGHLPFNYRKKVELVKFKGEPVIETVEELTKRWHPNYRLLKPHETIQEGDQFKTVGGWYPVKDTIGSTPSEWRSGFQFRRKVN